jgi:hypothetical protein
MDSFGSIYCPVWKIQMQGLCHYFRFGLETENTEILSPDKNSAAETGGSSGFAP